MQSVDLLDDTILKQLTRKSNRKYSTTNNSALPDNVM